MRIKNITSQNRRDFNAIFECEHCNFEEEKGGYDDANFHNNVVPKMICKDCNKISDGDYIPLDAKYDANQQV